MRKSILAIAAAGSVFAITAAGAAGLSITGGDTYAVDTSSTVSSVSDTSCRAVGVAYNVTANNITGVTLTSADGDCVGKYVVVTLSDGNAYTKATAKTALTSDLSGGGQSVNLTANYDASANPLASAAVSITLA